MMQVTSAMYKLMFAQTGTTALYRIRINGIDYTETQIVQQIGGADVRPRITGSLFSGGNVSAGGTAARTFEFTVTGSLSALPRMARVEPFVRLLSVQRNYTSEEIPCGVFYIDSRKYDPQTLTTAVTAYDPLMKLEQSATETLPTGSWPRAANTVVAQIGSVIGAQLDSRTTLNGTYQVTEPEDRNVTLRQVLGWIGGIHGGNWIITNAGKLRLITLDSAARTGNAVLLASQGRPLSVNGIRIRIDSGDSGDGDGEDSVTLGKNVQSLHVGATYPQFTGVQFTYKGENTYFSGTKTGYVMTIESPYATQAIAGRVLSIIGEKYYQPYEAAGALLDPAAELGDSVIIDGYSSLIATSTATFGALYVADISAPGDEEIEREFPRFQQAGKITKTDVENIIEEEVPAIVQEYIQEPAVITNELYADYGDIADLVVDRLRTDWRRAQAYLSEDTSDINFIYIHDETIEYRTAKVVSTTPVQLERDGKSFYWRDETKTKMTYTAVTEWPVMVYQYEEQLKAHFAFDQIGADLVPRMRFGAGNDLGNDFMIISKERNIAKLLYQDRDGEQIGMTMQLDGYTDIYGLRRTAALDFSGWDSGSFTETVQPDRIKVHGVTFDSEGRPTMIDDVPITW